MQHRERFTAWLANPDVPAFIDWIESHSPLDRVDILTEFNEWIKEFNAQDGDVTTARMIQEMEEHLDAYQDSYLEHKLAELNMEIAKDEADKAIADYVSYAEEARAYVRQCIELNAPNADEAREVAWKMIDLEQQSGLYRPEEWAWLTQK